MKFRGQLDANKYDARVYVGVRMDDQGNLYRELPTYYTIILEFFVVVALIRAVAANLKVVRRRKPSSAEGTKIGRAREGDYSPSC